MLVIDIGSVDVLIVLLARPESASDEIADMIDGVAEGDLVVAKLALSAACRLVSDLEGPGAHPQAEALGALISDGCVDATSNP